jgi:hypothetical protein
MPLGSEVAEVGGEEQVTGDTSAALCDRAGAADVFISYASADKAAADSICVALERGGVLAGLRPAMSSLALDTRMPSCGRSPRQMPWC